MNLTKQIEVRDIRFPASLKVDDSILFTKDNQIFLGAIASFNQKDDYPAVVIGYNGEQYNFKLSELANSQYFKLVVLM